MALRETRILTCRKHLGTWPQGQSMTMSSPAVPASLSVPLSVVQFPGVASPLRRLIGRAGAGEVG